MNAANFVLGALVVLLAGLLNGSWNISVASAAPASLRSVGPQGSPPIESDTAWTYDHAWLVYSLHSVWVNVLVSLLLVPPSDLFEAVSSSPASDTVLIVVFSFLWGLGTYGFGLAIQITGLGLGTTLTMSVIVVVGTLLPLVIDPVEKLFTASGGTICAGLAVCGLSFLAAAKATNMKDMDDTTGPEYRRREAEGLKIDVEMRVATASPSSSSGKGAAEKGGGVDDKGAEYTTFQKVAVCVVAGVLCTQLQFAFVFSADMRTTLEKGEILLIMKPPLPYPPSLLTQ